jgi:hypothetical protein
MPAPARWSPPGSRANWTGTNSIGAGSSRAVKNVPRPGTAPPLLLPLLPPLPLLVLRRNLRSACCCSSG